MAPVRRETDEAAPKQVSARDFDTVGRADDAVAAEHVLGCRPQADGRQRCRGDDALVQRAHDRAVGAELHEEGADDRGHDAGAADGERVDHEISEVRLTREQDRRQNHGRDHRHRVGLEKVGGHAGAVTDVVADVVGNRRRVARIVFRNAGFHLADEVAADVRTLGEDAAAETGEDRDQRSAEAERDECIDHLAAGGLLAQYLGQHVVVPRDAKQRETGNQHAGDGARLEGDVETFAQRLVAACAVLTLARTDTFMPM